jgi:hypothetical protein
MSQAFSRRPLIAKARVRVQDSHCRIYVGQSGAETGFHRVLRLFPASIISLWLAVLIYHLWDEQ